MDQKISIITLNWNGINDTLECLESLLRLSGQNYEIIIVDNGSEDQSITKLRKWSKRHKIYLEEITFEGESYSKVDTSEQFDSLKSRQKILLIKNDQNYGFARGNNIAIDWLLKRRKNDFIFLLNNDATVESNLLSELTKSYSNYPRSLISPIIYNYFNNHIWFAGGKINWFFGATNHLESIPGGSKTLYETERLSGCALFAGVDFFSEVGSFDPVYFAYFEDADLCLRAKEKGYKCLVDTKAKVYHKISQSSSEKSPFYTYLFAKNRIIFMKKNCKNKFIYAFFLLFQLTLKTAYIVIRSITRGDARIIESYISGTKEGLMYSVVK